MSFTHIETVAGAGGGSSSTATFSGTASQGELLVASVTLFLGESDIDIVVPSGYIKAGEQPVSDRYVAIYYKEAVGTESDVTFSDSTDDILVVASRYSKGADIETVTSAVGSATNATSVSVGPVSTETDALCIAMFRKGGTAEVSQSFSDGFTLRSSAPGEQNDSSLVWVVDKIAASSSESVTHTLSAQTTRQSAVLVSFTELAAPTPTLRKGSQFTVETTLSGTVTAATLNGNAITVDSQVGTTVTLTDSGSGVTTSGEYNLVLTDDSADPDETIAVQVNVYGVAPSNNPLQKDGSALASLTGVQLRVTDGANLNGTELYYSGTGTTDASGNLGNIDLSSTAAADTDPVLLHMRTSAGDSIIASETVGLI